MALTATAAPQTKRATKDGLEMTDSDKLIVRLTNKTNSVCSMAKNLDEVSSQCHMTFSTKE